MEDMITKTIAPYFVSRNGSHKYKDEVDGKIKTVSDWWGAVIVKNAADTPEKTTLLVRDFYTNEILRKLPIVLEPGEGKVIINKAKDDDGGINLGGLDEKRLSLELDYTGSRYIIMYPLNARRHSPLNTLKPEHIQVPLVKK